MIPDPSDMLLFASVLREGSFTAAARSLGVSKQQVSLRVARLEDALGVRLLERTTRRVRPTEAGQAYFEHCTAIEGMIEAANERARASQQTAAGRLRVTAPALLGRRLLGPVVTEFVREHPAVRLELTLLDRRVDLVAEGFDVAVRVGALEDSSLTSRWLGDAESVLVASPARVASCGGDVAEMPYVAMHEGERREWDGKRLRDAPALVVNDLELLCEAAIAGIGLARLPVLVCADALASGRLVRLGGDRAGPTVPVHAVFPSRAFLPLRVRRFLDLLARHLRDAPLATPGARPSS